MTACSELLSRALALDPVSSLFLTESAFQHSLTGAYDTAQTQYAEAAKLDEANAQALYGSIGCKISAGNFEDAEQELDFLMQIQAPAAATAGADGAAPPGMSAELFYLGALLQV